MATAKMASPTPAKVTLLDGKLHIFRRPATRKWWCGFHHKGAYPRTSTGCEDLEDAKRAAQAWYFRKQVELEGGAPAPKRKTFAVAAEKALAAYEGRVQRGERSKNYLKGLRKIIVGSLIPVIGKLALDEVGQATWYTYKEKLLAKRAYARSTVHQHKMGFRIVLVEAYKRGELKQVPALKDDTVTARQATPRVWFEPREYAKLCLYARRNIKLLEGTRWHDGAKDLYDYILFVANTGLRIGEARNVRFCDVEVLDDRNQLWRGTPRRYLIIRNIKGKRGTGECKSYYGAYKPFMRLVERRGLGAGWTRSTQRLFPEYHREMFRSVLERANLRFTQHQPPLKRDLMSLRHTYICTRLLSGASVYEVANNCRTSVAMIEEHYARWLAPRNLAVNVWRHAPAQAR